MEKIIDTSLTDAIHALSMYQKNINAEFLDEVIRQYPQHAEALTDFAIELVMDLVLYETNDEYIECSSDTVDPVIARVMSKVQNSLYDARQKASSPISYENITSLENPFLSFDRKNYRSLALKIGVNTVFLSKIRDRQIDPTTIPVRFMKHLAEQMHISSEKLKKYLFEIPLNSCSGQFYKSQSKPEFYVQQSFDDAIQQSALTDDLQKKLLSFVDQ